MPKRIRKPTIDRHTAAASVVAAHSYFTVVEISGNENPGLLVGTEVYKYNEPESTPSKYWNGLYWSCLVVCPNGETRRVGCDVLQPRNSNKYFKRQQKIFPQVAA